LRRATQLRESGGSLLSNLKLNFGNSVFNCCVYRKVLNSLIEGKRGLEANLQARFMESPSAIFISSARKLFTKNDFFKYRSTLIFYCN